MTYTVRMVFLNQGETPPAEQLDGPFASVRETWDAGTGSSVRTPAPLH